jgi:hypothetical protein
LRWKFWGCKHDTDGWAIVPDRFFADQYALDQENPGKNGGLMPHHKMIPEWMLFFGYGKYPWKWEKQDCRCKKCGVLFWEADLVPLKEKLDAWKAMHDKKPEDNLAFEKSGPMGGIPVDGRSEAPGEKQSADNKNAGIVPVLAEHG